MSNHRNPSHDIVMTWAQQSPVDLGESLFSEDLPTLRFDYPSRLTGEIKDDNLHVHGPHDAALHYGQLKCPLVRLHFHQKAEHSVQGEVADLEVHLIHQVPVFPDEFPSIYLVVGVFFDSPSRQSKKRKARQTPEYNSLLEALIPHWFEGSVDSGVCFDPHVFLPPKDRLSHYRYEGSLTTPPFTESVSWIVLREHARLDEPMEYQVEQGTWHSPRKMQLLTRRFVLRNFR